MQIPSTHAMATSTKVFLWQCLCFSLCVYVAFGTEAIKSTSFVREDSCRLQDRLDNGCAEEKHGVFKSLVACGSVCREGCLGFVKGNNNDCYTYKSCVPPISCKPGDELIHLHKDKEEKPHVCLNGGVLNALTNKCKCVNYWVGDSCERHPVSCRELFLYGYSNVMWVDLYLNNYPTPIKVMCYLSDTSQSTIILSNSGRHNYVNKTWSSYVNGFYENHKVFWLGLEKIKALNGAGLDLLYLQALQYNDNKWYHRQYNGVRLSNAFSGYSFTFTSTNASDSRFGDCLGPLQGAKFSTYDHDNDEDPNFNCANQNGMGWWFTDCNMPCKLLGLIDMAGLGYVTRVRMMFVTH